MDSIVYFSKVLGWNKERTGEFFIGYEFTYRERYHDVTVDDEIHKFIVIFEMNEREDANFHQIRFGTHTPGGSTWLTFNPETHYLDQRLNDFLHEIQAPEELRNIITSPVSCYNRDFVREFENINPDYIPKMEFYEQRYSEMLEMLNTYSYVLK
jgi:hypothetical protein